MTVRQCQINGRFLTQRKTGVQRYAYEITQALGAAGANYEILAPTQVAPDDIPPSMSRRVVRQLSGHLWEQVTLARTASSLLLNFCNTGPVFKRRQIVCIHGASTFVYPQSFSRAFRLSQRFLLTTIGRGPARLATVSQASADLLYRLGIVPAHKPIAIIPNGHEHALRWRPENSAFHQSLATQRPFVLLIGSQAPHKNVRLITSLAGELDALGLDILVCGGSFNIFRDDRDNTHAPNVKFLGYVSDDDLALLLSRALCLAFPSFIEGFGLPLLEAMAHRCPLVASDTTSMPEVCGDAALLVSPEQPLHWLEAIRTLQARPDLRDDLIERGLQRLKLFSWPASAKKYLTLIGEMGFGS